MFMLYDNHSRFLFSVVLLLSLSLSLSLSHAVIIKVLELEEEKDLKKKRVDDASLTMRLKSCTECSVRDF